MCHNGEQFKGDHDPKNVRFDLSDSLGLGLGTFLHTPCTFQGLDLDLHFVASIFLSWGGDWNNLRKNT